jgi:hypothetical protein
MVRELLGKGSKIGELRRYPGSGTGARVIAWGVNGVISLGICIALLSAHEDAGWAVLFLLYPTTSLLIAVRAIQFGVYITEGRVVVRSWFTTFEIMSDGIHSISDTPYAGLLTDGAKFLPGPFNPVRMIRSWRGTSGLNYRDYPVTIALRPKTDSLGFAIAEALGVEYVSERKERRPDSGKRARK